MVRPPEAVEPWLEELLAADAFDPEDLPAAARVLVRELRAGGFFVSEGFDELESVSRRRREVRPDTLALTVLPTMACNLRCVYCFQARRAVVMSAETRDAVVADVERRAREDGIEHLEVDWFGGEPLVAIDTVDS